MLPNKVFTNIQYLFTVVNLGPNIIENETPFRFLGTQQMRLLEMLIEFIEY